MILGVIALLALAVSMDGFTAGLSCGLRRLWIPFSSLLVICLASAGAIAVSMLLGGQITGLIPLGFLPFAGGGLLIALGLYVLLGNLFRVGRSWRDREREKRNAVRTGSTGLKTIVTIARHPEEADLDRSGELSIKEAALLGLALAADAFGVGFGAAMMGLSLPLTVVAVGLAKLVMVPLGAECGRLASGGISLEAASVLSGAILICIGVITIAR